MANRFDYPADHLMTFKAAATHYGIPVSRLRCAYDRGFLKPAARIRNAYAFRSIDLECWIAQHNSYRLRTPSQMFNDTGKTISNWSLLTHKQRANKKSPTTLQQRGFGLSLLFVDRGDLGFG